jgi:hypothetical protein
MQKLFLYFSPGAEILLRRREGEKFKNSTDSNLQALCQSFDRGVGIWGFGNVLARSSG